MNGPRQEVVGPQCVCGATLWAQGKWEPECCPLVGPRVFTGVLCLQRRRKWGREAELGYLGSLVSLTPEMARGPPSQCACLQDDGKTLHPLRNHDTDIYSGMIH